MKNRLFTSIGIVLILVLGFVLKMLVSSYFFDALILVVACFAAFETAKMFTKMGKFNYTYLAIIFPIVLMVSNLLGFYFDSSIGLIYTVLIDIALIVIFFAGAFLFGIAAHKKSRNEMKIRKLDKQISVSRYAFNKAFNTGVTFIYPSFVLSLMSVLNHLDELTSTFSEVSKFAGYASFVALLFMVLIPIFTDTFAFISGSLIKGPKLAPSISPNKHISGAVLGSALCVLFSICTYLVLNAITPIYTAFRTAGFELWHVALISLFGSIISQLGDLFESFLKRKAGVKDSGKLFPGHGGMLDRFDSYTFVAPYLVIAFVILIVLI